MRLLNMESVPQWSMQTFFPRTTSIFYAMTLRKMLANVSVCFGGSAKSTQIYRNVSVSLDSATTRNCRPSKWPTCGEHVYDAMRKMRERVSGASYWTFLIRQEIRWLLLAQLFCIEAITHVGRFLGADGIFLRTRGEIFGARSTLRSPSLNRSIVPTGLSARTSGTSASEVRACFGLSSMFAVTPNR